MLKISYFLEVTIELTLKKLMMNYKNKILLSLLFLFGISILGKSSLQAQDEKRPIPVCVANTTVIMYDNSIEIFAKYFDRGSFDEGTSSSELRFTYSDIPPEQDPDYNELKRSSSKVFSFPNDTSIAVTMFVWDLHGNSDFCTVMLNLQKSDGTSHNRVNGRFVYNGNPIEINSGVDVTLKNIFNNGINSTINTTSLFDFNVLAGTYKLSAYNDKERIKGVTTYDLVIILKHILQLEEFDNPYSYFAADVRKDDVINALDIIQLRRIILGIIDSFPQNTSWRFGNAMQVFDSIPEALDIGLEENVIFSLDQDTSITRNLIPVKTGDVNHSNIYYGIHNGIDNNQQSIEPKYSSIIDFSRNDGDYQNYSIRNENDTVSFNIEEYLVEPGQEICIPITVKHFTDIAGFQFPVSWDKNVLALKGIENTSPFLSNFGNVYFSNKYAENGEIFAVWTNNSGYKTTLDDGTALFELCFTVSKAAPLYTSLDFNSNHGFKAGVFDYLNPIPFVFNSGQLANSAGCLTFKTVKLNDFHSDMSKTILAEDLYIGEEPGDTLLVNGNPSIEFNCSNKGLNDVILSVTHSNGEKEECTIHINVKDVVPPVPVCNQNVMVTLGDDGIAKVSAKTFDNGSFDNCQSLFFKVIRWNDYNDYGFGCAYYQEDDDPTTDQIDMWYDDEAVFCCEDLVSNVMFDLRVFDTDPGAGPVNPHRMKAGGDLYGRFNDCLVYLEVNCEAEPVLDCPPLTVNCEDSLDPNKNPEIKPELVSLCDALLDYKDRIDNASSCESEIIRTWTATGCGKIVQCEQHLKIEGRKPFNPCTIEFPKDIIIDTNTGSQSFGEPVWDGNNCNIVTAEILKADTFLLPEEQIKIIKDWAIIDWCKYVPNSGAEDNIDAIIGRKLDCSNLVEDGFYRYSQIIILNYESNSGAVKFNFPANSCVAQGKSICVPMSVKNFNKITGFQMSITWDESILKFDSLKLSENYFLKKDFPSYKIGNKIRLVWVDGSVQGLSLKDNTIIFKLCFTAIGEKGEVSYLNETNNDLITEVIDLDGNRLDYTFREGKVSIVNKSCPDTFSISLNSLCSATVNAIDLYTGQDPISNVLINGKTTLELGADNLGLNCYTLLATKEDGSKEECSVLINVKDEIPPIAICDSNTSVSLTSNNTAKVFAETFDAGSYDNCQPVYFKVLRVDDNSNYDGGCIDENGDDNPETNAIDVWYDDNVSFCIEDVDNVVLVALRVFDTNPGTGYVDPDRMKSGGDLYGRYNDCFTKVKIENKQNDLTCIHHLNISVDTNEIIEITPQMLLEGNQLNNSQYSVQIFDNRNSTVPQDDNIIDFSDHGKTYYATVSDIQTGNYCTSILHIGCDKTITIDDIQWPCDLELSICDTLDLKFSPDSLIFLGAPIECTKPIINNDCSLTSYAYEDVLFHFDNYYKLIREWYVIDWYKYNSSENEGLYRYTQVIIFNFDLEFSGVICDTLPWNTPVGDCASGHTLDDDVEWPADIVVNTLNITPDNLKHNNNIHPNDVEPLIINDCNDFYDFIYQDKTIVNNDSFTIVNRTWTISNDFNGEVYQYTQKIEVKARLYRGGICTYTENYNPIPNVEVINDYFTSEDGCVSLENIAQNTIIAPKKDDDWKSGLDYFDIIFLRKYLYGQLSLSPYQKIAADIDESGFITSLDLILLNKIILGTYVPPAEAKVWKFVDAMYQFPLGNKVPVDYPSTIKIDTSSYNQSFIGIKMGDLYNGNMVSGLKKTDISSQDEILNKGEYYDIDILSNGNFNIEGIQLDLEINSENIELINLSSDVLKDFSVANNVVIENDRIKILYSKDYQTNDNYLVEPGSVLFTLKLKAKQNAILHESLGLNQNKATNILKSITEDLPYQLFMKWKNKVSNKTYNISSNFDIRLYPQPASDCVYVRLKNSSVRNVNYIITNIVGEVVQNGRLNNNRIGVSHLQTGLYFVNFYDKDGKIATKKMIVSR